MSPLAIALPPHAFDDDICDKIDEESQDKQHNANQEQNLIVVATVNGFSQLSRNPTLAAEQVLGYLANSSDAKSLIDAARLLIFFKGNNAHDYKFSSAALEDYYHVSPAWRDRYLASSVFKLRGSGGPDNQLVARTRDALSS